MLEILYTGAFKCGDIQDNPLKSLGGFCSSSLVPNLYNNNLFSSITPFTVLKDRIELIGLMLKNSSTATLTNIKLWTETPVNSYAKFEIAVVSPSSAQGWFMERIPNKNSLPYNATFYNIEGIAQAVNLPDLIKDGRFGIWIKRTLIQTNIINLNDDDTLYSNYQNNIQIPNKEQIDIKIKFD